MATVKENLIAAKALIDMPEKWIKGTFHAWMPSGTECFCLAGAVIEASSHDTDGLREAETISALVGALDGFDTVIGFNDAAATTHADIMALFDRAIAAQDGA
ncbi:MAG TPA: hypothetical protein VN155_16840 [Devosia sp.]|nr:hypothetical protein [Devosia sp.]